MSQRLFDYGQTHVGGDLAASRASFRVCHVYPVVKQAVTEVIDPKITVNISTATANQKVYHWSGLRRSLHMSLQLVGYDWDSL